VHHQRAIRIKDALCLNNASALIAEPWSSRQQPKTKAASANRTYQKTMLQTACGRYSSRKGQQMSYFYVTYTAAAATAVIIQTVDTQYRHKVHKKIIASAAAAAYLQLPLSKSVSNSN